MTRRYLPGLKVARELLRKFVDIATYETEYAHQMMTCCIGCGVAEERGTKKSNWQATIAHKPDCPWVAAKKYLEVIE